MSDADAVVFTLRGEHVALCDLLKLSGLAGSGGQGKALGRARAVTARRSVMDEANELG